MRKVIVTDSDISLLTASAASINRTSTRFSIQNAASASSLSNIGTSSQLATEFMIKIRVPQLLLTIQRLIKLSLVEKPLFGLKRSRVNDPDHFPIRPINTKYANPAR